MVGFGNSLASSISFCNVKYNAAKETAPPITIPIVFKSKVTCVFLLFLNLRLLVFFRLSS